MVYIQQLESMKAFSPRPITEEELNVIRQALQRAALMPVGGETFQAIGSLTVKAECECGCRSVEFDAPEGKERMMADGVGYLDEDGSLNKIIWGRGTQVSRLEVVDPQGAGKLPDSVCSWDEAGRDAF